MKTILECSVKQKQMAPDNLLGNNLYQLKLLGHCVNFSYVTLTNIPKQCLWNFRGEAASYCVSCAETLGWGWGAGGGSRLGNDPISLSGRLTPRTPDPWSPANSVNVSN